MERLGGEVAALLMKIGGIIALILGLFEIAKGVLTIIVAHAIGGFLSFLFPGIAELIKIIPIGGALLAAAYIIVGAIVVAVGYSLTKIPVPTPPEEKGRWTIILAVLIALALIFGSYGLLVAFALALASLLLAPSARPPAPPPTGRY